MDMNTPPLLEPYDPVDFLNDGEEDDDDDEEYHDVDEEILSRGRSRSRSMHVNDEQTQLSSVNSSLESRGGALNPLTEISEKRTGPLQHREVLALQKGLEEASTPRDEKRVQEEEEERRAAEEERLSRTVIISDHQIKSGFRAPTRKIKILMLGDSGVGKTSLVYRWTQDDFNPCLVGTVGVDFKCKKVEIGGEVIQVQVWDTAGQEQFHRITQTYYRGAHAIMLVYDVSEPKTLQSVEYWMKNINSHASNTVQTILVGNKTDLRDECEASCLNIDKDASRSSTATPINDVSSPSKLNPDKLIQSSNHIFLSTSDGEAAAERQRVSFFETSAKMSTNVDAAFYTLLHHILLNDKTFSKPLALSASGLTVLSTPENRSGNCISNTSSTDNDADQNVRTPSSATSSTSNFSSSSDNPKLSENPGAHNNDSSNASAVHQGGGGRAKGAGGGLFGWFRRAFS